MYYPTQEGRTCLYYPHSKQREKLDGLKETILPLEGELEGVGQLIQRLIVYNYLRFLSINVTNSKIFTIFAPYI